MLSRTATEVHTPLFAKAIVLDDGATRLAIVVVDTCAMPRSLLDEVKSLASKATGIHAENMLISATHTHSAPAVIGGLGTDPDPHYPPLLKTRLVKAIEQAAKNVEPARVGAAVGNAAAYTAVRRWIRRPDRVKDDPFGNPTVRANMHPGYQSPDATGPAGPTDPDLSVISFQSKDGRPIALLANFSMHYYGAPAISADYFGLFSDRMKEQIAPDAAAPDQPPFVAIMSHGPSGDVWLRDYLKPAPKEAPHDISSYTDALVNIAYGAYETIQYRDDATLAMAQTDLPLKFRLPDKQRLEWARGIVDAMEDGSPKNTAEVYAREAIFLHEQQGTSLILQALRIGEIGITAIPNEVYALTSLKLKAYSPLETTVNIELANGSEGYIPPPEQHPLGGYNTWPARSASLEVNAEPKIVETVLQMLEKVAGKPRRQPVPTCGEAARVIVESKPVSYWRMDEFCGPEACDVFQRHTGVYEAGVVYHLDGARSDQFNSPGQFNRAPHFAGGRMRALVPEIGKTYSVSMWFWNGMPSDARPVAGYLFSRGRDHAFVAPGDHLGIGGTQGHAGKLIFCNGDKGEPTLGGSTAIQRWTWNHVVLVRDDDKVRVYLNGNREPEIDADVKSSLPPTVGQLFIGGRCDRDSNFEGRIDETAIYDRALTDDDVAKLYRAATGRIPPSPSLGMRDRRINMVAILLGVSLSLHAGAVDMDQEIRVAAVSQSWAADDRNLAHVLEVLSQAAAQRADIVCLPENCVPTDGGAPAKKALRAIAEAAARHEMYVAANLKEQDRDEVHSTSYLLGPEGRVIGKYRKSHRLPDEGIALGDALPVFDTPLGKIGLMIGTDHYWPEIPLVMALEGAELILASLGVEPVPQGFPLEATMRVRALDNHVTLVCSDYAGPLPYLCSNYPGYAGEPLGRGFVVNRSGIIVADTGIRPGVAIAQLDFDRAKDIYHLTFKEDRKLFHYLADPDLKPTVFKGPKRKIRVSVATVPFAHGPNPRPDSEFAKILDEAGSRGSDVIVMSEFGLITDNENGRKTLALVAEKARKYESYVIIGGLRDPQNPYSDGRRASWAYLWDRAGKVVGKYRISQYGGSAELPVFKTDFGVIAIILCGDIYSQEISRALAIQGAEIIFCPSQSWGASGQFNLWMQQARAIDNGVWMAAAHLPMSEVSQRSYVLDPYGYTLAASRYWCDSVCTADIDLDAAPIWFARSDTPGTAGRKGYLAGYYPKALPEKRTDFRSVLMAGRRPELYGPIPKKTLAHRMYSEEVQKRMSEPRQ